MYRIKCGFIEKHILSHIIMPLIQKKIVTHNELIECRIEFYYGFMNFKICISILVYSIVI